MLCKRRFDLGVISTELGHAPAIVVAKTRRGDKVEVTVFIKEK
jgi:hypothetical protein